LIRRNVKRFIGILLVLAVCVVWLEKYWVHQQLNQTFLQALEQRAALVSRVNLLSTDNAITTRQGLSAFLAELESIPEIVGWHLVDEQNRVMSHRNASVAGAIPQYLYFYSDNSRSKLVTLKLYFNEPKFHNLPWSWLDLLVIIAFVLGATGGLYLAFKWVLQTEKYAEFLLKDPSPFKISAFSSLSNPVSQIINQLILKNSLLVKDKTELTEQIRKISYVDEVTELGNQMFFKAEFQVRLHNHEEGETGLLVLLSFRELDANQSLVLTDERLRNIAILIRQYSMTISQALVARLRDNDFALLLPNQTRENTDKICKTLIEQLAKSVFDKTSIKDHFVDIGISAYKQGFDYYKVVAEADMALRNAQLQGGNNWFIYGEELAEARVKGHIRWRNFLQHTLETRQLQLYGQSINYFNQVDFEQREVLVRIEDGKEVLTADTFLPMANRCGLAIEFDRQVVDGVIKHCLYQEKEKTTQKFSINLFIASLLDEKFIGWIIGRLSSYPELSQQITFEFRESHINQHLSKLKQVMERISELGVTWCIEHFGSPDEDLAYLEILPIKSVKIDRRIIYGIHANHAQQLLLHSLKLHLKSLNILAIAEGVENEKDADYLAKSGISAAQGFYYGQPTRMTRVEKFLKAG
jgi:RNase E specificity factor CsrD